MAAVAPVAPVLQGFFFSSARADDFSHGRCQRTWPAAVAEWRKVQAAKPTPRAQRAAQASIQRSMVWLAPALLTTPVALRRRGRGRPSRRIRRHGSRWTEVASCPVYFPEAEPPCCLVHFVGGAISGLPRTTYSRFLEAIAEETGAVVVATPLKSNFNHQLAAKEAAELMDNVLLSLQRQGLRRLATAPIWSCGHGTGAVVQLLVAMQQRRAGLVLLGLTPAPNVPLPNLPKPLAKVLSGGLKRIPQKQLKQGGRLAETLLRGWAELNSSSEEMETTAPMWRRLLKALESSPRGEVSNFPVQVFPGILSLTENVRDFSPSREELAECIRAAGTSTDQPIFPKRLLLVEFSNDPQDDSAWLLSVLGCQAKDPPQEDLGWDPLDAIEAELEKELAKSSQELAESCQELAKSSQVDPLDVLLEELAESSQELAKSSQELAESSQELAESCQELAKSSQELAESSQELAESMEEAAWDEEEEEEAENEEISEARKQLEAEWEADEAGVQDWEDDPDQPRTVELMRLKGDCWIPLDFQEDLDQLPGAVARFLRREPPPPSGHMLPMAGAFALKAHLLRMTAGANRGFGPMSFKLRGDVLAGIYELEKMSDGSLPTEGGLIPDKTFGRWRLMWSTAPAVLLLSAVPFVECGEIEQEFTRSGETQELEFISRTRVAPMGSALLAPWNQAAQTQVELRASVEVISSRRLLLHFQSTFGPFFPRRSENLNLTFLDDEMLITRSGLGEASLWLRA